MGNCLKRNQTQLQQNQQCPKCHLVFQAQTSALLYQQHVTNCRVRPIQNQPVQSRNLLVGDVVIEPNHHPIPNPNPNPRTTPHYIQDDFQNRKQKYYWCKELLPGSKIKYKWNKKLSPPMPAANVSEMLALPWVQIKNSEFPIKQTWFRLQLEKKRIPWQQGAETLSVNKESFLMTTLNMYKEINWHKEVKVHIDGDKVLDAGGLLREWANLIMKEIIHPESGMFQLADCEDVSYKINCEADTDEHIIDCFKLLGIVVGKCIFERIPLNIYFDRSIIKHIIGQPIFLEDIYYYDRQLYQSWDFLVNNKFEADDISEFFVIYRQSKGDYYELKKGGQTIQLDMDNCQEYVNLCIEYYTYISVKPFLTAFLSTLYSIIPKQLLSLLEPLELEMILYGTPFIDINDWKDNTDYKGAYYRTHQTIQWFWEILEQLDQFNLAKFLQFCTGSTRTPVEGFRKLESNRGNCSKFCIESVPFTKANPYPKAHTCFNRLELPMYETREEIESYLKAVIQADMDGQFGME
ncbi:unnamed protein product [Paramecium primaurelia]|uniref:HECT domain-containing protein n=1 Tax=Paramecium primaurelia TaxID=5886 RepID=A0A8S1M369_PARPR|nr:unnamed protein product [Paramecium primaurelia]